jgi:hypothetical protein
MANRVSPAPRRAPQPSALSPEPAPKADSDSSNTRKTYDDGRTVLSTFAAAAAAYVSATPAASIALTTGWIAGAAAPIGGLIYGLQRRSKGDNREDAMVSGVTYAGCVAGFTAVGGELGGGAGLLAAGVGSVPGAVGGALAGSIVGSVACSGVIDWMRSKL